MTGREILDIHFAGASNAMTPDVVSVGKVSGTVAYELSKGRGFLTGQMLYGVTMVAWLPEFKITAHLYGISKSFRSEAAAREWIEEVRERPALWGQELAKFDDWRCRHGQNRWAHPECWVFYLKGFSHLQSIIAEKYGINGEAKRHVAG